MAVSQNLRTRAVHRPDSFGSCVIDPGHQVCRIAGMSMPAARVGDIVHVRDETWCVTRVDVFDACRLLALEGCGPSNPALRGRVIEPFDLVTVAQPGRLRLRRRDTVLRGALGAVADERPADGLWAAGDAQLTLLPYQLEPALAVLEGATRVLLADTVGLGKTVQAGLILAELRVRGLVERALVLTPAGLRNGWTNELSTRFGIRPAVLDQASIAEGMAALWAGANPWAAHEVIVASIDLVKRPEVLAAVEAVPFDLLIVDEVHHLTPGSERGAAVARLASRVCWLVLASATPHGGDEAAFTYLSELGSTRDLLTVFRRTGATIGRPGTRREHLLAVNPTGPESALHAGVEAYTRAIWRARGTVDPTVRLVATVLARRAASSAAALERTLARRLACLSGEADPAPRQPRLPWEDPDDEEHEPGSCLGQPGLEDTHEERRQIEALRTLAREAGRRASKVNRLRRLLERTHEPAVVFTEYRDTLEALHEALAPLGRIAILHGGLVPSQRHEVVDRFNQGGTDVLIATDAAGEGINLHHRCRLVINVELPWNPRRLEQRVGRVDRLGQTRRVHAIHLFHRRTIEARVLAALETRRLRAGATLGDPERWTDERDIAACALGDRSVPMRPQPTVPLAEIGRAAAESDRLERQRRMRKACGRPTSAGSVSALPRRRATGSRLVAAQFEVRHVDDGGRLLARQTMAMAIEVTHAFRHRRQWRQLMETLASDLSLWERAALEARGRALVVDHLVTGGRAAFVKRLMQLAAATEDLCEPVFQASIFDGRAQHAVESRRERAAHLRAHLRNRAESLIGQGPSAGPLVRLVALFPIHE